MLAAQTKGDKDKKRPEPSAGAKGNANQNKFQKGASKGANKGTKGKRRDPVPQSLRECIPERRKALLSVLDTTWDLASKEVLAHVSMFAQCLGAIKLTRRQSISDFLVNPPD